MQTHFCLDSEDTFSLIPRPHLPPNTKLRHSAVLSEIVQQTLALARRELHTKPALSVLTATWGEGFGFEEWVRYYLADRYDLTVTDFVYAEDLLEQARHTSRGVVFLVLNNLLFRDGSHQKAYPDREKKCIDVVRSIKSITQMPVFVASGYIQANTIRKVLEAGADEFVPLPYPPETLKQFLETFF